MDGLVKNSINLARHSSVSILVYIDMASKEKMLHFFDTLRFLKSLTRSKESLKYAGMDLTIGCSMLSTQIPRAWGVEAQSEHTGLVFRGVL